MCGLTAMTLLEFKEVCVLVSQECLGNTTGTCRDLEGQQNRDWLLLSAICLLHAYLSNYLIYYSFSSAWLLSFQLDLDINLCVLSRKPLPNVARLFSSSYSLNTRAEEVLLCNKKKHTVCVLSEMRENELAAKGGNLARIPVLCT